jgi:hypothetical protein
MPEQLEFAPDFRRKRVEDARRLAELIADNYTAETLLDIALRYDELAEHAQRRLRQRRELVIRVDAVGCSCGRANGSLSSPVTG